jgi:hypothetical protein
MPHPQAYKKILMRIQCFIIILTLQYVRCPIVNAVTEREILLPEINVLQQSLVGGIETTLLPSPPPFLFVSLRTWKRLFRSGGCWWCSETIVLLRRHRDTTGLLACCQMLITVESAGRQPIHVLHLAAENPAANYNVVCCCNLNNVQ